MNERADERINELIQRIEQLEIEQRRLQAEIKDIHKTRTKTETSSGTKEIRNNRIRRDVNGDEIRVGDRVHFLTKGRYRSTQGRIVRFTDRFVISEDKRGNRINREYGNVQIIGKQTV